MNVRPETIKLPEENTDSKLVDISFANNFVDLTLKAKISTWDYIKLKNFKQTNKKLKNIYTAKEAINKIER